MPTWTKAHFELIAEILRTARKLGEDEHAIEQVYRMFSAKFYKLSPTFDGTKFREAVYQ